MLDIGVAYFFTVLEVNFVFPLIIFFCVMSVIQIGKVQLHTFFRSNIWNER